MVRPAVEGEKAAAALAALLEVAAGAPLVLEEAMDMLELLREAEDEEEEAALEDDMVADEEAEAREEESDATAEVETAPAPAVTLPLVVVVAALRHEVSEPGMMTRGNE